MADKLQLIGGLYTRTSSKTNEKFYTGYIKQDGKYINFIMFKNKYKEQQIQEGKIKNPSDFQIYLSEDRRQQTEKPAVKPAPKKAAPVPQSEPEPPPLDENDTL